jgi:serine protease Do
MIKQAFVALATTTLLLNAQTLNFNTAPEVTKRTVPDNHRVISYNAPISKAKHSIVNIVAEQKQQFKQLQQMDNPFFREFFGNRFFEQFIPQERKQAARGSGVIVSKDGYIVTNAHVIDRADKIIVTLSDSEKEYEAKLIGADKKSDIAVIKIKGKKFVPITMGNSDKLLVGDLVFALGNPFGVGQTVTQGIISAQNKSGIGINEYENFIQTDAAINPGNSGGALVDSRGALIGINSAILTRSGGNNGVGFAIPVNMVKNIAEQLVQNGKIKRGYLGVNIDSLNSSLRKVYKSDHGAILLNVDENSPSAEAGLRRGDLIVKINGTKIKDAVALKNRIGSFLPGTKIDVEYERNRKIYTTTVTLGNLSDAQGETQGDGNEIVEGVFVKTLTPTLRQRFQIPSRVTGVVIDNILPTVVGDVDLKIGDVIIQVEDKAVETIDDVRKFLHSDGTDKRVYVYRQGRIFITVM